MMPPSTVKTGRRPARMLGASVPGRPQLDRGVPIMVKEQQVSLDGAARDRYLRRLETRMEFLHDVISGHEDGWGLEGDDLESVVEHLSRVWAVVAAAEIVLVVDRGPL